MGGVAVANYHTITLCSVRSVTVLAVLLCGALGS